METYSRKETITPSRATELLQNNPNFRKLNNNRVQQYAADMLAGRWVYNGESIVLGTDNALKNGQHRLHACIASNTAFTTQIIYGVDTDVYDQGWNRSTAQYTHNSIVAGILTMAVRYEKGELTRSNLHGTTFPPPTLQEKLTLLEKYPSVIEYATHARRLKTQKTLLGFLWWVFGMEFPTKTKEFFTQYIENQNINKNNAAWHLRRRLVEIAPKHRSFAKADVLGWGFSALNAHVSGQKLSKLDIAETLEITGKTKKKLAAAA